MKKVSRTNDLAFKKAFSTDGTNDPLIGLAKDLLDIEIKDLVFKQPYSISEYIKIINKKGLFAFQQTIRDVSADIITDKAANLVSELQVRRTKGFDGRSLYYPAVTFTENYNQDSKKYSALRPVYGINILGFNMFERDKDGNKDKDGIRQFEFWDRRHNTGFPIEFIIAYFEYKKTVFLTDNQLYWRDYFLDKDLPPEAPEYIRHAASIIEYANMDEEERSVLDLLERAEADRLAREDYVKESAARAEARKAEKALRAERLITFQLLVSLGMTHEQIATAYSISADEVIKVLNNEYDDDIDDDDDEIE